jgi:hypothetical protein
MGLEFQGHQVIWRVPSRLHLSAIRALFAAMTSPPDNTNLQDRPRLSLPIRLTVLTWFVALTSFVFYGALLAAAALSESASTAISSAIRWIADSHSFVLEFIVSWYYWCLVCSICAPFLPLITWIFQRLLPKKARSTSTA